MKRYDSKKYLIAAIKLKTYKQIAQENNVNLSTIYRKLTKFNLIRPREIWSKEEIALLKREYSLNTNIYSLFPNRTISSVNHKASRLNIIKRVSKSKYTINSHFFDKWSKEMAYVLGWFFSDGCVHNKCLCCSIHLHKKDTEILEKIKDLMQSNYPLYFQNQSVNFRFHDYILHSTLINLGCIPRKSLIVDFPNVPIKYLSHFVRGYFDGDGSIYFNKPNTLKVRIVGSKLFIEKLQYFLENLLNIRFNKTHTNRDFYSFECYGDNARNLCKWIYNHSGELYLKRKRDRFDNHLKLRGELI